MRKRASYANHVSAIVCIPDFRNPKLVSDDETVPGDTSPCSGTPRRSTVADGGISVESPRLDEISAWRLAIRTKMLPSKGFNAIMTITGWRCEGK